MTEIVEGSAEAKVPSVRTPGRTGVRRQLREPSRDPARGNAVVMGRDGERLSRKRTGTADPFAVDPRDIPDGWEYQWNAVSVTGNQEVLMDQNLQHAENGWRPVPADRHPGRYMPHGHKGSIVRGGCRLDERPKILCDEAREEDHANAARLINDRNESLGLSGLRRKMPDGFEMDSRRYRQTGGDVRMSIDPGLDIPAPQHRLADPDE